MGKTFRNNIVRAVVTGSAAVALALTGAGTAMAAGQHNLHLPTTPDCPGSTCVPSGDGPGVSPSRPSGDGGGLMIGSR